VVLVKVNRISSYTDPETSRPGKIIELVEIRRRGTVVSGGGSEEAMMIQRMLQTAMMQMQSLGLVPPMREAVFPKLTLYLTEEEYDLLNIRLEVNEVYELAFKDGAIMFRRPSAAEERLY